MKKIKIIRSRPLKEEEEVIDQQPQDTAPEEVEITYESNPLEFMLMKYPTLTKTLTDLLTDDFRNYIIGVYIMAPKPTIFKIVLHNNRSFHLIYMGDDKYEAKVSDKKYWLPSIGEFERATISIAELLMMGTPPTTQGPETEMASTPEEETPEAEETGGEEEGAPEELAESKKLGIKLIKEASNLDSNTLRKPSPDKQSDRGQVLLNKINTKNSLTTVDGDDIVINAKKSSEFVDALKSKDYKTAATTPFYDTKGATYRLSKLAKTADFGGGKGSGGGAEQTAVQESAQCLVNAIRYNKGSEITEKDLNDRNYARAAKRIETTSSLDEMISFLNENPDWVTTTVSTANALAKDFPGNFKFYRGKGIATDIDRAAKSSLKTVIGNVNVNKWNPADIWMASNELDISDIPTDKGIRELNKWMKAKYNNKQLIGVSLKKCSNCGWKAYNLTNVKRTEKFESVEPKDKDFFKTKDIYINFTGGKIQFRNFGDVTSWQGEIKSKEAAGGKIGGRAISNAMMLAGNNQEFLPEQTDVLDFCENPDKNIIKNLYDKYKNMSLVKGKIGEKEFSKTFLAAPLGNRTSNYMNIELLYQLSINDEAGRDKFIQNIIAYSKSESNISSVFIKVS